MKFLSKDSNAVFELTFHRGIVKNSYENSFTPFAFT